MKLFPVIMLTVLLVAVVNLCQPGPVFQFSGCRERPVVNVPVNLRQINWLRGKEGSCCWASFITAANWQQQYALANWARGHCGGGESPESLAAKLDDHGVKFAWTYGSGDTRFLAKAIAGRRAVMVAIDGGEHMVDLVSYDALWACLVDNNHPHDNIWMPRVEFDHEWIAAGSWAVVPIYTPVPPLSH